MNTDIADEERRVCIVVDLAQLSAPVEIRQRFAFAAEKIVDEIVRLQAADMNFQVEHVLITTNGNGSVLAKIPSRYKDFHVKCMVIDSHLFIVELSPCVQRAIGVSEILGQVHRWNNSLEYFEPISDAITDQGDNVSSLDLLLTSSSLLNVPCIGRQHIRKFFHFKLKCFPFIPVSLLSTVMMELEIGSRSITQMRVDFLHYFNNHPSLMSVVVIKIFPLSGERILSPIFVFT